MIRRSDPLRLGIEKSHVAEGLQIRLAGFSDELYAEEGTSEKLDAGPVLHSSGRSQAT